MSGKNSKLQSIQMLRAVAVLLVLISHSMWEIRVMLAKTGGTFDDKLVPGDFGVDLFFVISGFIMIYATRHAGHGGEVALDYAKRRLVRIVPLYWTMTTLMIMTVLFLPSNVDTATHQPAQWLQSYLFIPFAREGDGLFRPVLGLGWSLNYEMFFYAVFALGLLLPRLIAPYVVVGFLAIAILANQFGLIGIPALEYLLQPIILEFAFGILIGCLYVSGFRISKLSGILLGLIAVAGLAMAPEFSLELGFYRHTFYGLPAMALVIAFTLTHKVDEMQLPKSVVAAGDASYSTYLVHPFVLGLLTIAWTKAGLMPELHDATGVIGYLAIATVLSFTISLLVHRYYDLPLTSEIARVANKPLPKVIPDTRGLAKRMDAIMKQTA